MSTSLSIQKIGLESIGIALGLLQRFFREEGFSASVEDMRASLHTMITDSGSAVFLACQDTQALGIATVTTSVGIEYGRSAELEDLYVLPEARRGGLASKLIETVNSWCYEQGCTTVLVTVTPAGEANHRLIEFYQERGFTHTGRVILARTLRGNTGGRFHD